jgi:hypothetical protein
MLVPHRTAAILTAKAEHCDERVSLARREEKEIADLSVKLVQGQRLNDQQAFELKSQIMMGALEEVQGGWWDHPVLWFGLGVVSAVGLVLGAVEILDATRPEVVTVAP